MSGGEGGIRTPDTLSGMAAFEAARFNRSRTSPRQKAVVSALWAELSFILAAVALLAVHSPSPPRREGSKSHKIPENPIRSLPISHPDP